MADDDMKNIHTQFSPSARRRILSWGWLDFKVLMAASLIIRSQNGFVQKKIPEAGWSRGVVGFSV